MKYDRIFVQKPFRMEVFQKKMMKKEALHAAFPTQY